ncbi:hypothetical protein [Synergistes jonesii]|uniref:hypothetical protein n=1 Tax=Synergistes jonesii TaxID=2754 RepID=UPI00248DE0E0|nr:hypothetical protein [Synergistes jonesii]
MGCMYIQEEELGEIASNVEAQEDKSLQNASTELYLENAMKQMEGEYKDQFIEAFKDAPDDIVGVLGGYGSQLRIGPSVSSRISRYDPQTKTVMCAINDSLGTINAIRHDSGHFIDHMIGREMGVFEWSGFASSCKEYSVACLSANMKYNPDNIFRRGNVKKMLKELEGVDYRTSPYLHDFVCSISMGRIETNVYHPMSYYKSYDIAFSETFADIFAMKAGNDSEGLAFMRKYFPDVLDTFNKILAGDFK